MRYLAIKYILINFIFMHTVSSQYICSSDLDQDNVSENNSCDDELDYWPKYMDDLPSNYFCFDLNDPHYLDHCFYDDEDEHNKDLAKLYEAISKKSAVDKATLEKIVRGSFSITPGINTQKKEKEILSKNEIKAARTVRFAPIPTHTNTTENKRSNAAQQTFIVRSHSPVNYNEMPARTRTKILSIFSLAQLHKMTENDFGLEPSKRK